MLTKLSKIFIIITLLSLSASSFAETSKIRPNWQEYRSTHFILYYHSNIPPSYIKGLSRSCEQYYREIAECLGLRRFDFWTWENRAIVVVYDSREGFIGSSGRPQWSGAAVNVQKKRISLYRMEERFAETLLRHEIAHIVLRELIGLEVSVPLWFEEGVACIQEEGRRSQYLAVAKQSLDRQQYLPVTVMEQQANPAVKSKSYTLFYSFSAGLVNFLLQDYYKEDFIQLCRNLRDGQTFYAAMDKVYHISGPQDLDTKFLTFLQAQNSP